MNDLIWNLFLQTGNIETYLLLKRIENEEISYFSKEESEDKVIASLQSKM